MSKLILNNVRLAYSHLDQPRASVEGAEPKYSCTLIVPKTHPQLAELRAVIKAAAVEKFSDKLPKGLRNPLRDGDETDEEGNRVRGDEFKAAFFLNASSKRKPEVVVGKARTAPQPEHLISGHYASVRLGFFGYDTAGNRGVGCGLNGVWITRRGEPLGAAAEPWGENVEAEDFDSVAASAAGAAPAEDDVF
jgi:Protein of unknown function (DUF2815)